MLQDKYAPARQAPEDWQDNPPRVLYYIMHEDREIDIPTAHYVDVCKAGYRDFGFDEKFFDAALERSLESKKQPAILQAARIT